jgi:hypothetical protein
MIHHFRLSPFVNDFTPALGIEADILFACLGLSVQRKKIVAESPTRAKRGECPENKHGIIQSRLQLSCLFDVF